MSGNLLLVHVHDIRDATPQKKIGSDFHWILNLYVPCYPELRVQTDDGYTIIPCPKQEALREIYYGFKDRIGRMFYGWTEMGKVASPWYPPVRRSDPIELRWIYEQILIATGEASWKEKLLLAEAECEEAFSVLNTYYEMVEF
jgi:hypothetical protein